jgi:hypothetical protein
LENGRLLYSPTGRSAFLVAPDGSPLIDRPLLKLEAQFGTNLTWHFIRDLNRPNWGKEDGLHLYCFTKMFTSAPAPAYAAIIASDLPVAGSVVTGRINQVFTNGEPVTIPQTGLVLSYCAGNPEPQLAGFFKEGCEVRIRAALNPPAIEGVGGGPRLVRDGKVSIEFVQENIQPAEAAYVKRIHPRSAAGISGDRRLVFFVVVDGRSNDSKGVNIDDLASLMLGLGAADAIMFDGGDSATLFAGNYIRRGRGVPRRMCNGLAIFERK